MPHMTSISSEERAAFWIGFAEHCGDPLTHMVLDSETLEIITEVPSDPGV